MASSSSNEADEMTPFIPNDQMDTVHDVNTEPPQQLKSFIKICIMLSISVLFVVFTSLEVLRLFAVFSGTFEHISPEFVQIALLSVLVITVCIICWTFSYIGKRHLSINFDIGLLFTFWVGGLVYLIVTAKNQMKCIHELPTCHWLNLRFSNSIVSIFFIFIQMILLMLMVCPKKNPNNRFPDNIPQIYRVILIIFLCLSNFFLWINLLLEDIWEHLGDFITIKSSAVPCRIENITDTNSSCYNLHWQQTWLEHFSFPFILENCLFSISIIWHVLMHTASDTENGGSGNNQPHDGDTQDCSRQCAMPELWLVLLFVVWVLFIVFTVCVRIMSSGKHVHLLLSYDITVTCFLIVFDGIPSGWICWQAYKNYKTPSNGSSKAKFSLNKFVYLTCVVMSYFYYSFSFFAGLTITSGDSTNEDSWMLIFKNTILFFILTLQSGTLLYVNKHGVPAKDTRMSNVALIIACNNFVFWLANEIVLTKLDLRPVQNAAFGEAAWYCIWHIVYPFRTFLRIYTCEILVKFRSDVKRLIQSSAS